MSIGSIFGRAATLIAGGLALLVFCGGMAAQAQIVERRPCLSGSLKDAPGCYCPPSWAAVRGGDGVERCERTMGQDAAKAGGGASAAAAVASPPAAAPAVTSGDGCGRATALDQDIVNGQLRTYAAVNFDPAFGDACLCESGALVRISSRLYGCRIPSGLPVTCNGGFLNLERRCVCLNQRGREPKKLGPNSYDCLQ